MAYKIGKKMEILLTAIALAMDSFALSIAGASLSRALGFLSVLKMALVFAVFQALMPFFGYIFGDFVSGFIFSIHHYIAFGILFGLGIKFVLESKEIGSKSINLKLLPLLGGGFLTSIDAFAVGITFGFEHISILQACLIIGLVCFLLCIVGAYLGKGIGKALKDRALIVGGIILMGIGYKILIWH